MHPLLLAVLVFIAYLIAYKTYGQWLAKKIFKLDPASTVPSKELQDDLDYVPTPKFIVFGHHFTSIAGTGPIVGPAIAVLWGWLPAVLWVLFGSIFIGAVHDFGTLVVSLRNQGKSIGDISGKYLSARVRILFLVLLFCSLTLVLAIFGLVISAVFKTYPNAILPCIIQIPIAIAFGLCIKKHPQKLLILGIISLLCMLATIPLSSLPQLATLTQALGSMSTMTWTVLLLVYAYIASVLPVWLLLQPRDYINSLQLITSLALIIVGLVAASFGSMPLSHLETAPDLEIVAPIISYAPAGAPSMLPFLFITVACGAISGFHCLVSSGTSSKQIASEPDAKFIGYGSMLLEGFLATLVIIACVAGISLGTQNQEGSLLFGTEAYDSVYKNWKELNLGNKIGAFVTGAANFIQCLGLSSQISIALMGVLVASFAATTLDSACRLQRYILQELVQTLIPKKNSNAANNSQSNFFQNKHLLTIAAILLAIALAAFPISGDWSSWQWSSAGKGGLMLWPLFGATNQLLAGLAFMVLYFWLKRTHGKCWFILIPMLFMLTVPAYATIYQLTVEAVGSEQSWLESRNYLLIAFGAGILILEMWMIGEAIRCKTRKPK